MAGVEEDLDAERKLMQAKKSNKAVHRPLVKEYMRYE